MKKPYTFNLNTGIIILLDDLKAELGTTKTDIVEKALQNYASHIRHKENKYLKYAGILSDKTANMMLEKIYKNRDSKPVIKF